MLGMVFGISAAFMYGVLYVSIKVCFMISTLTIFDLLYHRSLIGALIVILALKLFNKRIFDVPREVSVYLFLRVFFGFFSVLF